MPAVTEADRDPGRRRHGDRARPEGLRAVQSRSPPRTPSSPSTARIRCSRAGSMDSGRAAVFASDAKSRWASNWVTWPGYDKFWMNVFRDLLPHAQAGEATIDFDGANGESGRGLPHGPGRANTPTTIPGIFVIGPGGFQRPVHDHEGGGRRRIADEFPSVSGKVCFVIRPVAESTLFPEVGFYRPEEELVDFGSNQLLLRKLSEYTGGHFNPKPKDVFDAGGRSIASSLRLWPGLLALADPAQPGRTCAAQVARPLQPPEKLTWRAKSQSHSTRAKVFASSRVSVSAPFPPLGPSSPNPAAKSRNTKSRLTPTQLNPDGTSSPESRITL